MQRAFARFFLVLFLLQNTIAGELLKLPLLFEHYAQHKQLYPQTTVYGFIKMHYMDPTVVDADYAQDMQLPFKTINNHCLTVQLSLPPTVIILRITTFGLVRKKIPDYNFNLPVIHGNSIFQPPQIS